MGCAHLDLSTSSNIPSKHLKADNLKLLFQSEHDPHNLFRYLKQSTVQDIQKLNKQTSD